jgi:hypothetical protein
MVDACIAPLVQAMNDRGVHTLGCCCGHGEVVGSIVFQDDDGIAKIFYLDGSPVELVRVKGATTPHEE